MSVMVLVQIFSYIGAFNDVRIMPGLSRAGISIWGEMLTPPSNQLAPEHGRVPSNPARMGGPRAKNT